MCPESLREGDCAHRRGLGHWLPDPAAALPVIFLPSQPSPPSLLPATGDRPLPRGTGRSPHVPSLPQVSHVLAALQAGNRGTQACITAASAVSGIIADLDTTIMFATAGTLNREGAETFADHR